VLGKNDEINKIYVLFRIKMRLETFGSDLFDVMHKTYRSAISNHRPPLTFRIALILFWHPQKLVN